MPDFDLHLDQFAGVGEPIPFSCVQTNAESMARFLELQSMRAFPILLAPACLLIFMAAGEPPVSVPATKRVLESQGVATDDVSVSIVLKRATISTDEQPEFQVRFKNDGKEGYRNLYDVGAYWKWTIQLTPTDPRVAGEPGPWRLDMNAIPHRPNIEHRQIKPGESTDVLVNLNDPPFTFKYTYAGAIKHLVLPIRHLAPGRYQLTVQVSLTSPFGPGYFEWNGPVTTQPVELTVTQAKPQAVTKEEQAAYGAAIDKATAKLPSGGLWTNGGSPRIDLPRDASVDDVIDLAVNNTVLDSKVYHILSVKPFSRDDMPGTLSGTAALVQVGRTYKVVVFFPTGRTGWWSRFYDADVALRQAAPATRAPAATQPEVAVPVHDTTNDAEFVRKIVEVFTDCQKIKPGMTRAELTKLDMFDEDRGPLHPVNDNSFTEHAKFEYRTCSLIKVDVDFGARGAKEAQPTDIITKVSMPYIDARPTR